MGALVAAAFLFGATFVVIKSAVTQTPPLTFVGWRFLLGGAALALIMLPRGRRLWIDGAIAGLFLFLGYALQTAGLTLTGASNSALITGLYVVFTPLLAAGLARRSPSPWAVIGAVIAFGGLILLTGTDGFSLQRGDLLTVGCALAFAAHIIALSRFAYRHPVVPFTSVQLLVTSVLAFLAAGPIEGWQLPASTSWGAIALTGLGVSGVAFLLQVWAQTIVGASVTAVVLSAEPAFGVATAWVVLGERLDATGFGGALLILVAVYLVVTTEAGSKETEAEAVSAAR